MPKYIFHGLTKVASAAIIIQWTDAPFRKEKPIKYFALILQDNKSFSLVQYRMDLHETRMTFSEHIMNYMSFIRFVLP